MQVIRPLRVLVLLFYLYVNVLGSFLKDLRALFLVSKVKLENAELVKSMNGLGWLIRLFQHGSQLSYGLEPDYAQTLKDLDNYRLESVAKGYVTRAADELFGRIMKVDSSSAKVKAL